MKIVRPLITGICSVVCVAAFAQQPRMMTFDEALNETFSRNPQFKASEYELKAAEQQRKATYGLRLPKVGMSAAYTHLGDDIAIDLNPLKTPVGGLLGGLAPSMPPAVVGQAQALLGRNWEMNLQDRDLVMVNASITLPIYTGGKINAANNASKINVKEAAERGEQSRNSVISELVERYYGLSLALQVVEVRKQVLDGMNHHLSDAKALESNGIIARSERLYAEVHVAQAEREYLNAKRQVETLRTALGNTLNSETEVTPVSLMFILNNIQELNYFKTLATENSPLLKQVELKRDLAKEGIRLQKSEFMPQLAVIGGANLYNYQLSKAIPRWAVGAGIKLNIFDGLNREYKYSAAKNQLRQVEAVHVKANNDITTLIEKLYNEMNTYKDQMPSIDSEMEFAEEYLRIKDQAFREGAVSSSDVVDAQLNLAKVRTARLQAAYYYDLMLARLLEACGMSDMFRDYARSGDAVFVKLN